MKENGYTIMSATKQFSGDVAKNEEFSLQEFSVNIVNWTVGEASHVNPEHALALAPDQPTVTPMAVGGTKTDDVRWTPGAVAYLPPGVDMMAAILEPAKATYVSLPDRLFRQAAYETIEGDKLDLRWMLNFQDPVIAHLISAMGISARETDISHWPLVAESIGTALAVRLMQSLGAQPKLKAAPYPDGLAPAILNMVQEYIEANLGQQIRLTELAGVATLSTFHFARSFKKATGMAPVAYVWHRRLIRAKDALRNKALPLVAVAYDCGFSSQSHFTTAFKKATGMTPAAWRAALTSLILMPLAGGWEEFITFFGVAF